MFENLDILSIRQKMAERRAMALRDAYLRTKRDEVIKILFATIPRQTDMKRRSDMIDKLADKLVDLLDEQETPKKG